MNWREILHWNPYTQNSHNPQKPPASTNSGDIGNIGDRGCRLKSGPTATRNPYTQYPHNPQKPQESGNSADIADSAYRVSKSESHLLEALAEACRGLAIKPADVALAMSPEDKRDWRDGNLPTDALAAFANAMVTVRAIEQGRRPTHYTEPATCALCGPVWLWFRGEVQGCPWCRNRLAGRPIPRPVAVKCQDCAHFMRKDRPHLGHCAKGQPEPPAGLWDTDRRGCEYWIPTRGDTKQ